MLLLHALFPPPTHLHTHTYHHGAPTDALTDACACACLSAAGHLTCVKLLLDEGADIEQRNVVR